MSIKKIPDKAGNTLTVLDYKGRLVPAFDIRSIEGVATFKARPDDVVICAYPKSGTHWIWEMVRVLIAGTTDVPQVEKDVGMIEDVLPEELEKLQSPRSLNLHFHFDMLPKTFFSEKCKLVYVTRDPRDVAVSYFHHHKKLKEYYNYNGNWHDYFPMFLEGTVDYESWFSYTKGWEKGTATHPDQPVFVTSYEAMHEDTLGELKKMSNFLGLSCEDGFLESVIQKCSFNNMRSTKGKAEQYDGANSPVMYRKGKVGDWKNHFTVTESEMFDKEFESQMTGTNAYSLYCNNNN